jgi:hypothetical protein
MEGERHKEITEERLIKRSIRRTYGIIKLHSLIRVID